VSAFSSRGVKAAGEHALARLDDDVAPPPGGGTTAHHT
jgi:hypothetical protein